MDIKGTTRVCGLIGNPVGHSVSPAIHNNLAQLTGKDMVYTTFKVEKGDVKTAVKVHTALIFLDLMLQFHTSQRLLILLLILIRLPGL